MNKQISIIVLLIIMISILIACGKVNNSSANISTTAIINDEGVTNYFEVLTDENTTKLVEIETRKDGQAITDRNGRYVTNNNTYIYSAYSNQSITSPDSKSSTNGKENSSDCNDNDVNFEDNVSNDDSSASTQKSETTTNANFTTEDSEDVTSNDVDDDSSNTTESPTDKDGWINKWY